MYKRSFLLAGLGPLVPNYSLLSSVTHTPSFADLSSEHKEAVTEFTEIRCALEKKIGRILVTEHGRVPVCRDDDDHHEKHCYHAHFLLFPMAPSITNMASSYYRKSSLFATAADALRYAETAESYLLISDTQHEYYVFEGPLNTPRQLARNLVAHLLGISDGVDWRMAPDFAGAVRNAAALRSAIG